MPNVEAGQVKAALVRVFNSNEERIARLFSPGPKTLKTGLEREAAEQYRDILKKAGAVVYLRRSGLPGKPVGKLKETPVKDQLSLAPMEGNLVRDEERSTVEPLQIDTSTIQLAPPGDAPLQHPQQLKPAIIPASSGLSIAEPGADILANHTPDTPDAPNIDSSLSLAPLGTVAPPRAPAPAQSPDTSHLQVEPPGDLLKPHEKPIKAAKPPPIPDFDLQSQD